MRCGIISDYSPNKLNNFGDYAQMEALCYLYSLLGMKNITDVSLGEIRKYTGEKMMLPINYPADFLFDYISGEPLFSPQIKPVILGISFNSNYVFGQCQSKLLPESSWVFLRENGPVGCRDEYTRKVMSEKGVDAYLQGCLTSIFPKRLAGSYDETIMIDCPRELLPYIPDDILRTVRVLSPFGENQYDIRNEAKKYYAELKDHAKLVVSTRFHVVTPCAAMGIPAIFIKPIHDNIEIDYRLETMIPGIPIYTKNTFSKIDWNTANHPYEEIKRNIVNIAGARLSGKNANIADLNAVRDFYQPSVSFFSDHFQELKSDYAQWLCDMIDSHFPYPTKKTYYIWGAKKIYSMSRTAQILDTISSVNKNLVFNGWIDSFQRGTFFGRTIFTPKDITLTDDEFIIVTADKAVDSALEWFKKMRIGPEQYLICATGSLTQQDIEREQKNRKNAL